MKFGASHVFSSTVSCSSLNCKQRKVHENLKESREKLKELRKKSGQYLWEILNQIKIFKKSLSLEET